MLILLQPILPRLLYYTLLRWHYFLHFGFPIFQPQRVTTHNFTVTVIITIIIIVSILILLSLLAVCPHFSSRVLVWWCSNIYADAPDAVVSHKNGRFALSTDYAYFDTILNGAGQIVIANPRRTGCRLERDRVWFDYWRQGSRLGGEGEGGIIGRSEIRGFEIDVCEIRRTRLLDGW